MDNGYRLIAAIQHAETTNLELMDFSVQTS
jgi:hypothetical protein